MSWQVTGGGGRHINGHSIQVNTQTDSSVSVRGFERRMDEVPLGIDVLSDRYCPFMVCLNGQKLENKTSNCRWTPI